MKPEELDRLFRDELENLDHVPGIEWNHETVWNKISTQLKGGWNNVWTWTLLTITIFVSVFLIYQTYKTSTKQEKMVTPVTIAPTVKDATNKLSDKKFKEIEKSTSKELYVQKNKVIIETNFPDSSLTSSSLMQDSIEPVTATYPIKKYRIQDSTIGRPEFRFSMPANSYLNLKIKNQVNVSNMIKSIQAEKESDKNLYYFYEYEKTYINPPYQNLYPKSPINNTHTITNFKK